MDQPKYHSKYCMWMCKGKDLYKILFRGRCNNNDKCTVVRVSHYFCEYEHYFQAKKPFCYSQKHYKDAYSLYASNLVCYMRKLGILLGMSREKTRDVAEKPLVNAHLRLALCRAGSWRRANFTGRVQLLRHRRLRTCFGDSPREANMACYRATLNA